ncbi:hypothetical protein [Flavobacterium sp. LB1P62]|uniref:hypothetical protein n=1 Tax=Flavobacterium sp. LB1P62 TaxID=3401715 RepID=UPI003AAEB6CB
MNQSWFEMQDLRKRKLDNSVWIPLRAEKSIRNDIGFGKIGYQEEFIGHGSVMISVDKKTETENLNWSDIGISHIHGFSFFGGKYMQSDLYEGEDFEGIHLVLNQSFDNNFDNNEWHLHQDLVISLGLKREGDIWLCPKEGYVEVAKLERDDEGLPIVLQIKNQFLKDYLCARGCGLYITSYFSRDKIFDNKSTLSWNEDSKDSKDGKDFWECRVLEIHEGGFSFGQKIAVSHVGRTDIDEDDDVPDMTSFPNDTNVKSEFYEKSFKGKKLYRIIAELWKYEWINPSKISPIVLGDKQPIDIFYIVDVTGNKESGSDLKKGGKWLWFKPDLVSTLLSQRGSFLNWYTKDTGSVSCAPAWGIHFGMNDLGLITVYAKDIGNLPLWQQQIWAGHNISPEGGISKELHASQVKADPASTLAPEEFIESVINEINEAAKKQLSIQFFRGHSSINNIIKSINRFRAVDEKGLFSLAKDIARIIVDDIDVESLQKIAIPPKNTKWGSLKTVENLLSLKIPQEEARQILSTFVGVYELRHGDAHLPSSDIENSFNLIEIDRSLPCVIQGYQMIFACVDNLHVILRIIEKWNEIKK